jgi:hypothetical protein
MKESWRGWYRKQGLWHSPVTGNTVAEASKRLTQWLKEHKVTLRSNLDCCITQGSYPDIPEVRQ